MEKKRILLVAASNMSLSGVPVVFMSIVRSLSDKFTFDIVVLDDKDMYFQKEFLSYGGHIFSFLYPKPKGFLKKILWFFVGYKRKASIFIKNNIDISKYCAIHTFSGEFGSVLFRYTRKRNDIKKIFHVCSAQSVYKSKATLKNLFWNINFRNVYKYADKVLYVSRAALKYAKNKAKSEVLYNVYDEDKFCKIDKCLHDNLSLTQIGTFSSRKNQLFSLKLVNLLKESFPNIRLNMVGKEIEPGYHSKLVEYIKRLSLDNNVVFYDDKADRVLINKDTSYVLYPSLQDSFGLVLIESQAAGIHCFASDTIPHDADMGNIEFLPLQELVWSERIKEFFLKNGNNRIVPTELNKFSKNNFKNKLLAIYETHN